MKTINYKELKKLICFIPQQLDVCKQIALLRKIISNSLDKSNSLPKHHIEFLNLYNDIKNNGFNKSIKFTKFLDDTILVDGKHRCAICIELKLNNINIEFIDPEEAVFSKDISSDIIKSIHKEIFNENDNN